MNSQKEFPSDSIGFAVVFQDEHMATFGKTIRKHGGEWFEVVEEYDGNVATPIPDEKLKQIAENETSIYFL